MKKREILGYSFGIIGIILGFILTIKYPLSNTPIFFSVKNNAIMINLESNIILFSGLMCMIFFLYFTSNKHLVKSHQT